MAKAMADIRSLARAHTESCIRALASIVNQVKAPPSARVAAASELLDRGWGRAIQAVEHKGDIALIVTGVPRAADVIDLEHKPAIEHKNTNDINGSITSDSKSALTTDKRDAPEGG